MENLHRNGRRHEGRKRYREEELSGKNALSEEKNKQDVLNCWKTERKARKSKEVGGNHIRNGQDL